MKNKKILLYTKIIYYLQKHINDVFGTKARDNVLKKIINRYSSHFSNITSLHINKCEYEVNIKDDYLINIGFPTDTICIRFEMYSREARSLSIISTLNNFFQFSIIWSNDLNYYSSSKSRKALLHVKNLNIDYKITHPYFHPLDCRLTVDKKGFQYLTDYSNINKIWPNLKKHPIYLSIRPSISIRSNILNFNCKAFPLIVNKRKINKINIKIPVAIRFL